MARPRPRLATQLSPRQWCASTTVACRKESPRTWHCVTVLTSNITALRPWVEYFATGRSIGPSSGQPCAWRTGGLGWPRDSARLLSQEYSIVAVSFPLGVPRRKRLARWKGLSELAVPGVVLGAFGYMLFKSGALRDTRSVRVSHAVETTTRATFLVLLWGALARRGRRQYPVYCMLLYTAWSLDSTPRFTPT